MRPHGQIMVTNALQGGWFSSAQRFFTRLPYTHTALIMPPVLGVDSQLSIEEKVVVRPLDIYATTVNELLYQIYQPKGFTIEQIERALRKAYMRFAGETYGFAQVLWFVYRWFMEVFLKKDVRKQHNWFPNNPICSEGTWWYLYFLWEENPALMAPVYDKLNEWRPDTFNAGDTARVLQTFPDIFELVEERWKGKR